MKTQRLRSQYGGMIGGYLFKVLLGFAVIGVVLFDFGSIAVNYVGLDSTTDSIVNQIATHLVNRNTPPTHDELKDMARPLAEEAGARLIKVELDAEGTVHLRLKRIANTLVIKRIGPVEGWGKATADARSHTS